MSAFGGKADIAVSERHFCFWCRGRRPPCSIEVLQ